MKKYITIFILLITMPCFSQSRVKIDSVIVLHPLTHQPLKTIKVGKNLSKELDKLNYKYKTNEFCIEAYYSNGTKAHGVMVGRKPKKIIDKFDII